MSDPGRHKADLLDEFLDHEVYKAKPVQGFLAEQAEFGAT